MEIESVFFAPSHLTTPASDNGLTHVNVSSMADSDVAPPIPQRTSEPNNKTRATRDRRTVVSPVDFSCESDHHHTPLNGILLCSKDHHHLCPPLPPRQPLRRSVSLTHRPPPPPARFLIQDNLGGDTLAEPPSLLHQQLLNAPDLPRTVTRSLARSAPLLDQVIPISRWPLRERPTRPVHVIPLTRWPLPEATGRLAMDCIVTKVSGGNEYVDSPTLARDRGGRHVTGVKTGDRSPRPLPVIRPSNEPIERETNVSGGDVDLAIDVTDADVTDAIPDAGVENKGLILKLRRFVRRVKRSTTNDDSTDCKGRAICRRCGRCCCPDCTRSNIVLRCCGRRRGCSAESVIDVCSCMCCVRPIFYHCLKDENGEEDCSEEPCSCCGRPHCALRWTIMALLAPCLPCLCCYLPLHCALRSCRACCGGPGCHCPRNLPPGIKGLLESESSSA